MLCSRKKTSCPQTQNQWPSLSLARMTMSNFNSPGAAVPALEEAAGRAGCPVPRRPRSPCPPAGTERGSLSSDIRQGKGTKAENNSYCFPRLSSGQLFQRDAAAQSLRAPGARGRADAAGAAVPEPRCPTPTLGACFPLAQTQRQRALQGYPTHHSSCPTPQHHWAFLRCSAMGIRQCWVNGLTP